MGYTHIDGSERIERTPEAGKGVREIARMVGRSPGTISDELRRNRASRLSCMREMGDTNRDRVILIIVFDFLIEV